MRFLISASDALTRWARQAGYLWDGVQNGWNQWVLSYGPALQRQLLESIGLGSISWRGVAMVMVLVVGLLLAAVTYTLLRRQQPKLDPVVNAYQHYCRRLARHGLPRLPHEGAFDYARRVAAARPEWRTRVLLITRLYVALRYGAQPPEAWRQQLERQVRTFRP
ncbi:MAG: DUF4129 domain-containing protein [Pseudomonadota bacterium]|nr:MAG: DUF4129 domain-containing protein [Pseudomonadota bacterium]